MVAEDDLHVVMVDDLHVVIEAKTGEPRWNGDPLQQQYYDERLREKKTFAFRKTHGG